MSIYQHFRKEEHAFIDKVLEWKDFVEEQYSPKLTDFLDPREQEIIRQVVGTNAEIKVGFQGGHESIERKRALLYPSYFEPDISDFKLSLFELVYPSKFVTIEHRHVLGSLMSIGLNRSKFGDILTEHDQIQIVVAEEVSDFIKLNLQSIGKASVTLKEHSFEKIICKTEDWHEQSVTVSSLRIDVVMAAIFNLSRQKAQSFIQNNHVKVNWKVINNPAFECGEQDVISVRGFGRSKVIRVEGKTKKEKWRIIVGKQK